MTLSPFIIRHYPNLPRAQHGVQRIVEEFNAAEREWALKHPAKPKRKTRPRGNKGHGRGGVASPQEFIDAE